ncbi:MAG: site-2 protease family protein [Deltaproteobacteria bacterium]|nr:MAG: site-2 protease family protein [Deltaproteobacteria bacterium]
MNEIARKLAIFALPVLIGITFHEVAHGLVARSMGDDTAERMGRLSLNPVRHIDPLGTIVLPLLLLVFGSGIIFGYARPVPVNPSRFRNVKRGMVLVSAAGPGSNLAIALLSGLLFRLIAWAFPAVAAKVIRAGIFANPSGGVEFLLVPIALMLAVSVQFNVLLFIFNLIPIPPLDGGRIVAGLLPPGLDARFSAVEKYGMVILLLLLFIDPFGIMSRLFGYLMVGLSTIILGITV